MTPYEAGKLITKMQMMYIESFKGISKEAIKVMAETWSESFENETLEECVAALKRHANVSEFVPKIANIRKELVELKEVGTNTAAEAWEKCFKVAMSLPFYDQASWDLSKEDLSDIELKALSSIRVISIKMSENIAIERSNFIRIYKELQERQEKEFKMPNNLKSLRHKQQMLLSYENRKESQKQIEEKENDNNDLYSIREAITYKFINDELNYKSKVDNEDNKGSPIDRIARVLGVKRKKKN